MIWKLLRKVRRTWWRLEAQLNLLHSRLGVRLSNGRAQFGRNVTFDVRVRINGTGQVILGDFASLGAKLAPMHGNGAILIQARTPESVIRIGEGTWFSNNVSIISCARVSIGNDCLIGDGVTIFDSDFHQHAPDKRKVGTGEVAEITIHDKVWIGSRAMVLKGVTIGAGSIIAPMAVVTTDLPANCVAAGVPAKVLRYLG